MKKFIYKIFVTVSLICLFQVKIPYFHITQPSFMHHYDFVVPYSDTPVTSDGKD